ncbi:LysR family transcriptional regulator [Vibrio ulleungensis]|uniref:LysR family transcriptional regulator n=1 Tax=Vibrio ulleungensis TaxID=2807619 RepID=A0ABS2HIM5_9VIBR|nr:LysR family transcriptional regulator [Vibrio ulleungensis]MBM7036023.1 LysR family transcriptional regulator [Vibrio ulleungensis]
MNNDLNEIRIFAKVAQLQSFTKAAQALNIEKSTASSKVKQLENRLNIRLLQRTTRSVLLTPAGEQYLDYCLDALNALNQADNYIAELNQVPSGYLKVAVPHNFLDVVIDSVITPFLNAYPQVSLEIIQTDNDIDLIEEGCDLAVRFEFNDIADSSLVYRKLFDTQWIAVATPEFMNTHGYPKSIAEISALPSVGVVGAHTSRTHKGNQQLYWQGTKVPLTHRLITNNARATIEAIKADIGFGVMPKGMVRNELENGTLVQVSPKLNIEHSSMYVVYPSRIGQPAKAKAMLEALLEWAKQRQ